VGGFVYICIDRCASLSILALHGVVVERDSHIALAMEVSLFVKRFLVFLLILSLRL
jgi:hypothetical protein